MDTKASILSRDHSAQDTDSPSWRERRIPRENAPAQPKTVTPLGPCASLRPPVQELRNTPLEQTRPPPCSVALNQGRARQSLLDAQRHPCHVQGHPEPPCSEHRQFRWRASPSCPSRAHRGWGPA